MGFLRDGEWLKEAGVSEKPDGRFARVETRFRNWVTADGAPGPSGRGGFRAESGRYHLYVSLACPWAHRTLILRALKGLAAHVSVDVVHPLMLEDGWTFDASTPGATGDSLFGSALLRDIYLRADPQASGRVSVPVLWDRETNTIVSNESAEILRMFNSAFDGLTGDEQDFSPAALRDEIEAVNGRVYRGVNNGVYRAGFATTQAAYAEAAEEVFATLDWLDARLRDRRYLIGARVTEADWRLATSLFRFDAVYHGHFKCNRRRLVDYADLWGCARDLYQWPGVEATVNFAHITEHYYGSHRWLNPTGVVPLGPATDWSAPHGR